MRALPATFGAVAGGGGGGSGGGGGERGGDGDGDGDGAALLLRVLAGGGWEASLPRERRPVGMAVQGGTCCGGTRSRTLALTLAHNPSPCANPNPSLDPNPDPSPHPSPKP